jgi:Contractile injection system tube protein
MATALAKAELRELDTDFANEINPDNTLVVQFNPETLKVTFANQIATPSGAGDQRGPAARQFVGAGTTKLTAQLWFDVTAPQTGPPGAAADDVRKLTQKVAYFITPRQEGDHFVPPAVRFAWGSFQFDGMMDSMDESLEFFSSDGKPLRANVSISLSQQKIQKFVFRPTAGNGAGTRPLTAAPQGSTLQGLVGPSADWQQVAAGNNIENPRLLQPGQLIDLRAGL